MSERLVIKNFGPIKSVELELRRFNVLIGEQATGKSTIAKVFAICRDFSYIAENHSGTLIENSPFYEGLLFWGLDESLQTDTYIYYECSHYLFEIKCNPGSIKIERVNSDEEFESDVKFFDSTLKPISEEFSNLLTELKKIKPHPMELANLNYIWTIPTSFLQNDVAGVIDNPFYFPADRGLQSIFSLGKRSLENLNESLFNHLAGIDQIARVFKDETTIEPLQILYKNVDGRGYIKKLTEDTFYSIFNAASGYKSAIPIVLSTKYYSEIRQKPKTFIVEEPELDLFPGAQQKLIHYLVDKIMNHGNSILIETHSPYILTSLNNLMYAYQIGQIKPDETNKILAKNYWLNPDEVSAYMLHSGAAQENIMDSELRQIKAEKIDEVSRSIHKDYDAMLDLEFKNES